MSRQLALDKINLKGGGRFAHTEYSLGYHTGLIEAVKPQSLDDAFDIDFCWNVNDYHDWLTLGRATDMGHADYAENGADHRAAKACPFEDVEDIYSFDPSKEYGVPAHADLVRFYEELNRKSLAERPNQLVTGGYYKSVISGAIQAFGWDMLLLAAADQERFAKVLERFGEYTLHFNEAWADTSIDAFIQHDDMVWTSGPFVSPDFYRSVIFPIYKKLWAPLRKKGKKLLYCCDGTFQMFMKDVAEAGAEGFIFEPTNDFDYVVSEFGSSHCIVGSKVDCRTMAFGTWDDVKREMDETFKLASRCKGLIWAVGNHIPANVSDDICFKYRDYLRELRGKAK